MLLERLQLPSTGPKYFLADPFVRHQAKEIKIGLENNSMGKVWLIALIKCYQT